ncbi:MAG: hypothetical protein JRH20_30430, partial [Deltaproteobacteria bacterium]|nr:hypothetical protein [Deltaproteobacteria bacterium]
DYSDYFLQTTRGSEDLHLTANSETLWGISGADLSADTVLRLQTDVDGAPRHASAPDVGADEFGVP